MRISDWSSDVCSSDLTRCAQPAFDVGPDGTGHAVEHLVSIAGHFLLDAIVEACPPAERKGCGQSDIIINRPGIAPIVDHFAEPRTCEVAAAMPMLIIVSLRPPAGLFTPHLLPTPWHQHIVVTRELLLNLAT